jgi:hypothetical protein
MLALLVPHSGTGFCRVTIRNLLLGDTIYALYKEKRLEEPGGVIEVMAAPPHNFEKREKI